MGKFELRRVRDLNIPADTAGDRIADAICRRYGLAESQDYQKYLARVTATLDKMRVGVGQYRKQAWPAGYVPKTRNASAPAGKRWGRKKGE